eukprot:5920514-Pleurochrysis_carterae.AAC.2
MQPKARLPAAAWGGFYAAAVGCYFCRKCTISRYRTGMKLCISGGGGLPHSRGCLKVLSPQKRAVDVSACNCGERSCSSQSAECLKPVQNSGWLRLAAVIGVPLLLAVLLIMVPLHFLRRRERRKMDTLQEEHSLMERKLSSLSSQLHRLSSAGMPQSNDSRLLVFTSHQNSRPAPAPTPPHSTVSAATLSKQRRSRKMSSMIGDSPSTVQSLSSDSSSTQSHATLNTDNTETTSPASTGARHQNSGSESLEGGNRLEAFRHGASELKLEDVGDAEHLKNPRN